MVPGAREHNGSCAFIVVVHPRVLGGQQDILSQPRPEWHTRQIVRRGISTLCGLRLAEDLMGGRWLESGVNQL